MKNGFVDDVRINMVFNEAEYAKLVSCLTELSLALKDSKVIDKELALYLYTIPQMIQNAYLSFSKENEKPEIAMKLEDAWIDLDALVIDCLS